MRPVLHLFLVVCVFACDDLGFESVGSLVPEDPNRSDGAVVDTGPGSDAGLVLDSGLVDSGASGNDGGLADSDAGVLTPTCDDQQQNQGESAVDCGGPCDGCGVGGACLLDSDCQSNWCRQDTCLSDSFCPLYPSALYCDGFEALDSSGWTQDTPEQPVVAENGTVFLGASSGRGMIEESGQRSYVRGTFPRPITTGPLHMRAYYYVPAGETVQQVNILNLRGGATALLAGNGRVSFYFNKTRMDFPSADNVVPRDRWFCLEVDLDIGMTGSVRVRLDGTQVVSVQNIDTVPEDAYTDIQVPIQYTPSPAQPPLTLLVDELVVDDEPVSCDQVE